MTTAEVPANAFDVAVLSWSLCCVAPAGMVNALNNVYKTLRQDGILLDVRPARRHPWVEVQRANIAARLGQLDDSYRIGTQVSADAAVKSMIEAGRFRQERKTRFLFVYHFDSVDAWLDYMTTDWQSARIIRTLIARAREALPPGSDGELRVLRWISATRLRRI
jgi:SAM-dependent methyltransferase